jgi:transposase
LSAPTLISNSAERGARSAPILDRLAVWMKATSPLFEPKSPMCEALRYLNNQWSRLRLFLEDALIPIHNNASEAALRIVSLMRRKSLFFGNDLAGRRFMTLYSLIATCERHDVNPEVYLADILIRLQDHPAERVASYCRTD